MNPLAAKPQLWRRIAKLDNRKHTPTVNRRQMAFGASALALSMYRSRAMATEAPTLTETDWYRRSAPADDLRPQIAFVLREDVYLGDPNDSAEIKSGRNRKPLALPSFARQMPLEASSAEVVGHEAALATYYRQIDEALGARGRDRELYYWLRLTFRSQLASATLDFPWWDRLSDMRPLLKWIANAADESRFDDQDQGWGVAGIRRGERLHLLHYYPEEDQELANVSVDRAKLIERTRAEISRTEAIIAQLRTVLHIDPWS